MNNSQRIKKKKWDGKKWIETLPREKRKPKHTVDLNLKGDKPFEK